MRESLCERLLLKQALSANLSVFEFDEFVVLVQTTEACENAASLVFFAVVNEPTRREGHENHTDAKKDGRSKLESEGKKPCSLLLFPASATNVVGTIVDPETDHDTKRNAQLLETDKSATDFGRRNLGIVHGYNHGERTDTHTRYETTTENSVVALACGSGALNDDTDDENGNVDENSVFTGENLSEESRVHCSEPSTEFENGYEPTLLGGVPRESLLVLDVVAHV